jgi:hypothetical protein
MKKCAKKTKWESKMKVSNLIKVSELIEELEEMKKVHGDFNISVSMSLSDEWRECPDGQQTFEVQFEGNKILEK